MMRLRSLVLPLTVLALTVGCKKPGSDDTTSPPGETSSEKGDSGDESESGEEGSDSGDPEDGGSEEGAGGPGGCEAEIAKVPAAYFGDRVIIKMPKGVEMAEMNPFYAQMPSKTESVCETQIKEVLTPDLDTARLTIAYEPVWAIGTGKTATPDQAQAVHAFVRAKLGGIYGATAAQQLRIQYGGSVKPGNAAELFSCPDVDGGLVGGACLAADDFAAIIRAALPAGA